MAKFNYRMQNILDIKLKLETQARMELVSQTKNTRNNSRFYKIT